MKLKITIFTLFLMTLAGLSVRGQTQSAIPQGTPKTPVSGKVLDTKQEPVAFCTLVFTVQNDSTLLFTAVTDEWGVYATELPYNYYKVEARCLGYFPSEVIAFTASGSETLQLPDIVMEASVTNLTAAVVQSNTIERRADRFIVNLSANPIASGRSLYESLDYLPGVTTRNGISINGKSGTRVMVNNRMLNMSDEQIEQYLNNLRASDIQRVEVIPEAGAEYDANATGGILKITLKQQTVTGYFGSVSADVARAFDYTQSSRPNFSFSFRKDKWSVITNGYYSYMGMPSKFEEYTRFYDNEMEINNANTTYQKINMAGGEISTVYDLNTTQSIGVVANYGYAKGVVNTDGTSLTSTPLLMGTYINDNNQYNNYNRLGLSANYIHKLDSVGSTCTAMVDYLYNQSDNGGVYHTFSRFTGLFDHITDILLPNVYDTLSYRNNIGSQNNIISANLDFDIKLGGRNNFKAGGKFFRTQIDNDILYEDFVDRQWKPDILQTDQFTYTENVSALYSTYSSSLSRKWLYTIGLRAEYTQVNLHSSAHEEKADQHYLNLFPSLNLSFQQNSLRGHSISLTANRKIQRPNFSLLRPYSMPLNDFSYIVGNPDLKPAKSINLSLVQTLFHKYSLTVGAGFIQDYFAQIVTQDPLNPDRLNYQFANLKSHTQYYAALSAPVSIFNWWTLTSNAVGLYIKDQYNTGGETETSQKPVVVAMLMSNFILPNGWRPEINGMYISGMVQGNITTSHMYALNAGCTKSLLKDKLSLTLRLNNLIHQRLKITTEGATYYKSNINNMDMRTLYLSLRYSFNSGQRVNVKKASTGTEEEKARLQ
ncbi:MAG: TonB-dependent receptor [Bacteroidales bacterium]|nr:TonB-dependent receptor [Bacteroidales bacterium]